MLWDIFCNVIDNHGDLGVCWRLSADLAARGEQVRLWVDDAAALHWMAPGAQEGRFAGIRVLPWTAPLPAQLLQDLPPSDVWIEGFGCEIPAAFLHRFCDAVTSAAPPPVWINLEYLSAESYVERSHRLPSPLMHGPAAGRTRWFFYPGFTGRTGGLLREPDLAARQAAFDRDAWLAAQGLSAAPGTRHVSLFCYEPPALADLLALLRNDRQPTQLLVTAGRARAALHALPQATRPGPDAASALRIAELPYLSQTGYDQLLWSCELNFVRGEDSLVRALWAGAPFVWQIYPQHDNAHHAKLQSFLDWLQAPPSLRRFHEVWNGIRPGPLPPLELAPWRACVQVARARLLGQPDLGTELLRFVLEKR